jgi:hypothetical protein
MSYVGLEPTIPASERSGPTPQTAQPLGPALVLTCHAVYGCTHSHPQQVDIRTFSTLRTSTDCHQTACRTSEVPYLCRLSQGPVLFRASTVPTNYSTTRSDISDSGNLTLG